jgi:DNA polymerase III alpha subunit
VKYDQYGRAHSSSEELCSLLYQNPDLDISLFLLDDPQEFNKSKSMLHADVPTIKGYTEINWDIADFDSHKQKQWFMPADYLALDIAKWVLDQCKEDHELQRVGEELLLYQERDLFNLLKYLKYLVDTLREHNIVWGVGRGSSVASYVLYLIGVHKINSIFYQLDIEEFLK